MSYYPEPDSHIRGKVKVLLDLSKYATKPEFNDATVVDTSKLTSQTDFVTLKPKADKVDINKLIKVSSG